MNDWKWVKLSEIIDFNPKEQLLKGSISKKIAMEKIEPFTRDISEFERLEFKGGTKFRNGDTLIARITPSLENGKTAKVNLLDEDEIGFGSTEFIVARAKKGISDENFVYYLMLDPKVREVAIKSMVGTSGRQRVQLDVVKNYEILCPPLEEQIQIGRILSAIDDKIENNKKINHHLAEQISLIYNLAITTQKVTTKTIDEVTVKNEDIIAVSKINSNNYVSTTNMISDKSGINNNITLPSTQYVKAFHPKDILISNIRPYFKKIWYSNKSGGHSADVLNFRANTAIISPEILWAYLYQDSFFDAVTKSAKGTKMPRGDKNAIMKFKISIPANSKELTTTIRPILSLIAENNRQNYNLENLKSSLLPKLLSGELSVNQATK